MQTVVETARYLRTAAACGMSESEMTSVVDFLAADPKAGDEMKGTGGCRKVRFAGKGKGKSGGYRVITFYSGEKIPLFLLAAYSKNVQANLTAKESNQLKAATKDVVASYGGKIAKLRSAR
jgi:hypothetical protein